MAPPAPPPDAHEPSQSPASTAARTGSLAPPARDIPAQFKHFCNPDTCPDQPLKMCSLGPRL